MSDNIEKKAMARIEASERQGWGGIAFIWIGVMICVPMLMVGALMIGGMTLGTVILVTAIGFAICCAVMILTGIQGTDLGLPAVMCASKAFGNSGARIVVSLVLALAQFGWFGVQTAACGLAFSELMKIAFAIDFPFWLSALIWGIVMLTTAVYGIKFMKILNYIAVPALVIFCVYGVISAITTFGADKLLAYQPPQAIPVLSGISIMIGLFAVGTVINADFTRYAKSRGDTIKASLLGVLPAAILMIAVGAIMALVAGQYDITKVFASMGLPLIGMIVLILATWTTNTGNAYTAGLAVIRLFNIKDEKTPAGYRYLWRAWNRTCHVRRHGILRAIPGFPGRGHTAYRRRDARRLLDIWQRKKRKLENRIRLQLDRHYFLGGSYVYSIVCNHIQQGFGCDRNCNRRLQRTQYSFWKDCIGRKRRYSACQTGK